VAAGRAPRRAVAALFAALAVALATITTLARAGTRTAVVVTVSATTADGDALVEALGDLSARTDVHLTFERGEGAPADGPWAGDALARAWIDARAPDHVEVRITRPGAIAPYERVLNREGSIAVVAEAVAQVMRGAIDSMVAMDAPDAAPPPPPAATIDPADVPPPDVPPAAPRLPRSRTAVDVALFGSEEAITGGTGPVLGAGAAVAVMTGKAPLRPGVRVTAGFDSRFSAPSGQVTFDVGVTSFRVVPTLEVVDLEVAQLDVGLGAGLDLLRVSPLVDRPMGPTVEPPQNAVDPIATANLAMRLRLAPQVALLLGFNVDYDWTSQQETVLSDKPGGRRGTFDPWNLRPSVFFGLSVRLWGEAGGDGSGSPRDPPRPAD
jgi:hypothetical protein